MIALEKRLPIALFFFLSILYWITGFNGLYGQDAYEYLRQSEVFLERLGGAAVPAQQGEAEFGAGLPLLGALLTAFTKNAPLSLQLISSAAAALAVYFFLQGCRYFLPGSKCDSRLSLALLFLSAPVFIKSSLTSMSDMPALAFALGALFFSANAGEHRNGKALVWATFWAGGAALTRPAVLILIAPMIAWALGRLLLSRQFVWCVCSALLVFLWLILHYWAKLPLGNTDYAPAVLKDGSLANLFERHFSTDTGTLHYLLPNGAYVFAPMAHYGFCVATFLLFGLFKKTDLHLPLKKILLVSLCAYMLLIGTLPVQSIRYLLPIWAVGLWLLFPAWDRFYAYGMYFFASFTKILLGGGLALQLIGNIVHFSPVLARNQFEQVLAHEIKTVLPPGATLFTMDVDIALKINAPEINYKNTWERVYDEFPVGAYFLVNEERWKRQWAGMAPMINWENAKQQRSLQKIKTLAEGWDLYLIGDQ